jgi:hypothetical protein
MKLSGSPHGTLTVVTQAHLVATFASQPSAIELHTSPPAQVHHRAASQLLLRPTEDGWSLLTPDGALVLRGFGLGSRRQCLQYARALGVLTVAT